MLRKNVVLVLALVLVLSGIRIGSAAPYLLTDLGTLGGTTSAGYGVNDSGWVTGWADQAGSTVPQAFLATPFGNSPYGAYSMIDVSTLAGIASTAPSRGYSINDSGAMVGFADGPTNRDAFVYTGGPGGSSADATLLTNLPGALNGEGSAIWVFGINNAGQIAGAIGNVAFFYNGTTSVSLGTFSGGQLSDAYALNDNGLVVGNASVGSVDPLNYAFVSASGAALQPVLTAGFGGPAGIAFGINDAGTIVGALGGVGIGPNEVARSGPDSTEVGLDRALGQAFVATPGASGYTESVLPPLVAGDTTTNGAFGIDTAGAVVGESNHLAIIATGNGSAWTTTDLNTVVPNLGTWTLQSASAISQNGDYIVGYGTTSSGGPTHAFLLTAVLPGDANYDGKVDINDLTIVLAHYGQTGTTWGQGEFTGDGTVDINDLTIVLAHYGQGLGSSAAGNVSAVPEPSALLLAAAGLLGLLARARRKRK
jgi:hypothetical protein